MEQYYRLVIDTLKDALSDYVTTGDVDREHLREAASRLEMETDRRIVNREPIDEIAALKRDIYWVCCDLLGHE